MTDDAVAITNAPGPRSLVLGLTTSSERGGAALVLDGALLGERSYEGAMSHAERIVGAVDALLEAAGVARGQLGAIGCDVGPGSFTGVRAGLATAKGIALGLGLPLLAVGSLEAMASSAAARAKELGCDRLVALLDAKRAETFYAVYDVGGQLLHPPTHALTAAIWTALEPWARGSAVALVGRQAQQLARPAARWASCPQLVAGDCAEPAAASIARLAERRWRSQGAGDPREVEPVYTRPPDAKLPEPRGPSPTHQ